MNKRSPYEVGNRLTTLMRTGRSEEFIQRGSLFDGKFNKEITVKELAEFCRVSEVTIYNLMAGRAKDLHLSTALRMAEFFHVPVNKLFFLEPIDKPSHL